MLKDPTKDKTRNTVRHCRTDLWRALLVGVLITRLNLDENINVKHFEVI
jgi:hypothetical protein